MIIDAFIYDFSFLFCNSLLSITLDFSVVAPKTKFSTAEILQNSWELELLIVGITLIFSSPKIKNHK